MGDAIPAPDQIKDDAHCRWDELFPQCEWVWSVIEAAYGSPDRCYHNFQHIRECLKSAQAISLAFDDYDAVQAAIWFHDVVYDAAQPDNEAVRGTAERSLVEMGRPPEFIANVHDLILDTRHIAPPTTSDGRFLVDIDLAILGGTAEEFDAYDRAIRREYAHVPEEDYRVGRAKVLRSFLAREFIYHTATFRDLYESAARGNLARAIARLTAPTASSR